MRQIEVQGWLACAAGGASCVTLAGNAQGQNVFDEDPAKPAPQMAFRHKVHGCRRNLA